MKILKIIHCFPPDSMTGSEIYAYNLSKELSKNHTVSIFYRINNPHKKEHEIIKERYEDLDIYKINNTLKDYRTLDRIYFNRMVEERFLGVLDEVKPDVVHIHHLLFLSLGLIDEIKKRGIPIIFTLHDHWLLCPRGQLINSRLRLCKEPLRANCLFCLGRGLNMKTLFKRISSIHTYKGISKRAWIDLKKIYRDVDLFISPSRFLRDKFIGLGMPAEKIIYSDNGIDMDLFKDIKKTGSDKIRFAFIGTLIPSKGAHILIRAFNKIRGGKAILKIYGKSPSNNGIFNYFHTIKTMARGNKNIRFMGVFDNKDAGGIFKEIDVLIFPSIWEENSPIVLHEAMLTKTPVIASDIGGVNELIKHGENGFLFKPGDFKELFLYMQNVVDNIEKIKNKAQNPDFYIKSIRDNCEEMEKLYAEKISNQSIKLIHNDSKTENHLD